MLSLSVRSITGSTGGTRRRDDGSVIPRNSFVGTPLHRVDVRFQQWAAGSWQLAVGPTLRSAPSAVDVTNPPRNHILKSTVRRGDRCRLARGRERVVALLDDVQRDLARERLEHTA